MKALMAAFMLTFGAYLVVCLFTLVYGADIVGPEIVDRSYTFYIVFLVFIPVGTIGGHALLGYYLLLVATIVASAVWLLFRSASKFAGELTMKGKSRDHSPFFDLCGLMFAVFFINTVIVLFLEISGNSPISPVEEMEEWELLFILANASVWEEIIARVLMIGLPLMFVDALGRGGSRPPHKYLLAGGIDIRWAEASLVVISAVIFGFAHYEGWGSWKVFPAGVAGLAFGYMFLKHGLPAAIMLHFSFDYLSMPLIVFDDTLALQLPVALGIILWIGLGLVFTVYFTIRITEFLSKTKYLDPQPPPMAVAVGPFPVRGFPVAHQPPAQQQWHPTAGVGQGFFVCPSCGSGQARWHDGGLQCLGCGQLFK